MNKLRFSTLLVVATFALLISLACQNEAIAAARAFTDVEAALQIVSVTPGANVSFAGSGAFQKDLGPIPGAVTDQLALIGIAGTSPANNVQVPMSVGQFLNLDAQAEVRTDTLAPGQAAHIQTDISGLMEFHNTGATDATITFNIEREHRLYTFLDNPATEFSRAHKTFSLSAFTFNAAGLPVDSMPLLINFDKQVEQGVLNASPSDHFNFNLFVPAGGIGSISMQSRALSEVRLVPEPASLSLLLSGVGAVLLSARRHSRKVCV